MPYSSTSASTAMAAAELLERQRLISSLDANSYNDLLARHGHGGLFQGVGAQSLMSGGLDVQGAAQYGNINALHEAMQADALLRLKQQQQQHK